jgi:hypothetical protein
MLLDIKKKNVIKSFHSLIKIVVFIEKWLFLVNQLNGNEKTVERVLALDAKASVFQRLLLNQF